jgi:hypothetical protein
VSTTEFPSTTASTSTTTDTTTTTTATATTTTSSTLPPPSDDQVYVKTTITLLGIAASQVDVPAVRSTLASALGVVPSNVVVAIINIRRRVVSTQVAVTVVTNTLSSANVQAAIQRSVIDNPSALVVALRESSPSHSGLQSLAASQIDVQSPSAPHDSQGDSFINSLVIGIICGVVGAVLLTIAIAYVIGKVQRDKERSFVETCARDEIVYSTRTDPSPQVFTLAPQYHEACV